MCVATELTETHPEVFASDGHGAWAADQRDSGRPQTDDKWTVE